ncbi:MAG: hypothetical protein WC915_06190, partial [archaeon]
NNAAGVSYYYPNTQDFVNELINNAGSSYDNDIYMAAKLTYVDNNNTTTTLYVRAGDDGQVWNFEAIKDETTKYGPTKDATNTNWTSAIRDGSDYLLEAMTQDGSLIVSDNSVFTISVPEEQRLVQAYLGSDDETTTSTGGISIEGIAVGGTGTSGGTTVTVDAVAGSCSVEGGQAVSVVAVPKNLVKVDASTYGKSIIVGGFAVNAAAKNLEISAGQTLENMLTADGEYVAAVLTSGNIVVAGFNANDTGAAATELINALEALI